MKWLIGTLIVLAALFWLFRSGGDNPGWEYYPDMVYPRNPEPLLEYWYAEDTLSRLIPPEGTIPWHADTFEGGYYVFPFPPGQAGYDSAARWLNNPLPATEEIIKKGEELFKIYCAVCHGEKGDGQGSIVQSGAFPPVPDYRQIRLYMASDGQFFHAITYGKNLMPSYAKQLSVKERWAVIHYVRYLQDQHLRATQGISLKELQDSLRKNLKSS